MEMCQEHSGCKSDIQNLEEWKKYHEEKEHPDLWSAINSIRTAMSYRLPIWATAIIALQSGLIGWLLNKK